MVDIVTRESKGSPLTHVELDTNLVTLGQAVGEKADIAAVNEMVENVTVAQEATVAELQAAIDTERNERIAAFADEVIARGVAIHDAVVAESLTVDDKIGVAVDLVNTRIGNVEASVVQERQARLAAAESLAIDQQAALNTQITTLQAQIGAESVARASGDQQEIVAREAAMALEIVNRTSGDDFLLNKITDDITTEKIERMEADAFELNERQEAILEVKGLIDDESAARVAADTQEVLDRSSAISGVMVVLNTETSNRVAGDAAEAQARSDLATVLRNETTVAVNQANASRQSADDAIVTLLNQETSYRVASDALEVTNRNAAIAVASDAIKGGVASDGNTLAKLYSQIQSIQTTLASDDLSLDTIQEIVDRVKAEAASNVDQEAARSYTDSVVASEVVNRNAAIANEVVLRNTAISSAVDNLKDGVASDGDTLAKLRNLIQGLQTLMMSDDINLDTVQELVTRIKSDEGLITSLTTNKVNVVDIINVLTSTNTAKPLSAAQGKVLKDALDSETTARTTGDATALTSAKAYADSQVASEANARTAAIAVETTRAINAEADIIASVTQEKNNRIAAINAVVGLIGNGGGGSGSGGGRLAPVSVFNTGDPQIVFSSKGEVVMASF